MDIAFDPVTEADGPTLLQLACAFHVEDGHPLDIDGEAAIELIVKGDPAARAWIVRDAGEAVGYVIITLGFSVEYGGRDGFIDDLYLCRRYGGRGSAGVCWTSHFPRQHASVFGCCTLRWNPRIRRRMASIRQPDLKKQAGG